MSDGDNPVHWELRQTTGQQGSAICLQRSSASCHMMRSLCLQVGLAGSRPGSWDGEVGLVGHNWHVYHMPQSGVRCLLNTDSIWSLQPARLCSTYVRMTRLVYCCIAARCCRDYCTTALQPAAWPLVAAGHGAPVAQGRRDSQAGSAPGNWLSIPRPEIKVRRAATQ